MQLYFFTLPPLFPAGLPRGAVLRCQGVDSVDALSDCLAGLRNSMSKNRSR